MRGGIVATLDFIGPVERQAFFSGQRLFAGDLQEIEAFNRRMRWLHNMSLHQPGIGSGLAVTGKKDDRAVTVQPGYAIDAMGREIILGETHVEPVPPVSAAVNGQPALFDLTIAYPEEDDLEAVETRDGICLPRGAVRLAEEPVFCWIDAANPNGKLAADVATGMRLVLARIEVANCKLNADIDLSLARRRSARPPSRPYVAAGMADAPTWTRWPSTGSGLGIEAVVDTSVGKFATTPRYMARIDGPRPHPSSTVFPSSKVIDGPISITAADHDHFTIQVALLTTTGGIVTSPNPAPFNTDPNRWRVVWFGVES